MNKQFVYGTQYLRGTTPDKKDWPRDMENMARLNFNTIRAWLVWGVLESVENHIDTDSLEYFLECAKSQGLKVIFLFHLHGAPEWAIAKHSNHWYVNERGEAFEPSSRSNTPSGGWPGLCPDNPEVQELEERFIGSIVSAFGDHDAVLGWEPMNEPHMWMDFEKNPHGCYCYCQASRNGFREWLRRKFGDDLQALEEAWGHKFGSWDLVRPPTWRFGFSDWADWRTYIAENIAGHVQRRAGIIRRHSGKPVIAHAWGGGSVGCHNLGHMAFDDWKNAAATDIWGCSAFPHQPGQLPHIGLSMDSTRGAAGGRDFWQAELGTGEYFGGLERTGRARPEWFRLWSLEALAHGTRGLMFWQYRREKVGAELGCYGMTDSDGNPSETGMMAGTIGAMLRQNPDMFLNAEAPRAEVALLFSYQSHLTVWAQYRKGNAYVDSLQGYYSALWRNNIPVDIVHEEFLSDESLSRYKLLILPFPVALAGGCGQILSRYASNGGSIITDPCPCMFDPCKNLSQSVPGQGLDSVFGVREDDAVTVAGKSVELNFEGTEFRLSGSHFLATWKTQAGTEVLARDTNGSPVISCRSDMGGKLIASGVNLGMCNSPSQTAAGTDFTTMTSEGGTDSAAPELIMRLVNMTGIETPFQSPPGLRIVSQKTANGKSLLTVLNLTERAVAGNIVPREQPWRHAREIYPGNGGGEILNSLYANLTPWGAAVYEVS